MTATNPLNSLLAMSVAPRASRASSSFPGLMDVMFDAPVQTTPSAPSQKVADALIRSMMSNPAILNSAPQAKSAVRSSIPNDRARTATSNNDAAATPANDRSPHVSPQIESGLETALPASATTKVKTNAPVRVEPAEAEDAPANAVSGPAKPANAGQSARAVLSDSNRTENDPQNVGYAPAFTGEAVARVIAPQVMQNMGYALAFTGGAVARVKAPPVMAGARQLDDPQNVGYAPAFTGEAVARVTAPPVMAGARQLDAPQGEAQSTGNIGARARSEAQSKPASSVKTESPAVSPSGDETRSVARDGSSESLPIIPAIVIPAALPDVNAASETSAAADSDSTTAAQETAPVSTPAAAPAPVAFNAVLTPVSNFSAATPSPLQPAANETAPAELPFSFAASFSAKPDALKPDEEENATPANAANKDNAPAAPKSREEQSKDTAAPVTPAGAAPQSGDFSRATQSAIVIAADKPAAPETTQAGSPAAAASDSAQTPRAPEPPVAAPAPTPATPVQQIAVRIPQDGGAPVDLQITERGGEIHVSVRTADTAMQTSLRQDLGTLSNSLERAGYRAEMFTPRETSAVPAAREMQTSTNLRDEREQPGSGGGGSGNPQQGRQQQSSRDQRQKNWLEELENSK